MAREDVQVVFFDYGGTLAWIEPSADELWVRALEEHGYEVTSQELVEKTGTRGPEFNRGDIVRAFRATEGQFQGRFPENLREETAFFRLYDVAVLERLGIQPEDAILDTIERRFREDIVTHVFNDVRPTLERLENEGYRLGIISNASHDLPALVEQVDLARHFESLTYSYEVGAEKPDPRIFRAALATAGIGPAEAVHVGDHPEADVRGAAGVGITPMLIDRQANHPDEDCIVLRSLVDMWEYL